MTNQKRRNPDHVRRRNSDQLESDLRAWIGELVDNGLLILT